MRLNVSVYLCAFFISGCIFLNNISFCLFCGRLYDGNFPHGERSQISAAVRMSSRLRDAIVLQAKATAMRSAMTYLEILTPVQAAKYLFWVNQNRDRCTTKVGASRTNVEFGSSSRDFSLLEICMKLDEVLRISQNS